MKKRGFTEVFAYHISQNSNMDGVEQWLKTNDARVSEFLSWSKGYQWEME